MSCSLRLVRRLSIASFGLSLAACGMNSDVSVPTVASATPVNSGATLSGPNENSDAGTGPNDDSVIAELGGQTSASGASAVAITALAGGGAFGGTDGGGTSVGSDGGIGGAATTRGGAAGAGGSAEHASAASPTLFFSEYVEGSSSNKALEILALRPSLLEGCKVGAYFNGNREASVIATLSGALEAGQTLTLCTSSLKDKLGAVCGQVGRLTFNGNDAVALSCDGKLLDVIGQIGADPGAAWGTGATTTVDHTLRRKCSVNAGDTNGLNAFEPSLEWLALPTDTFTGLGARGC